MHIIEPMSNMGHDGEKQERGKKELNEDVFVSHLMTMAER